MAIKDLNKKGIVCIIINSKNTIEYSNINVQMSMEYIRELEIIEHLPLDSFVHYNLYDNHIEINRVIINKEYYFVINIKSSIVECNNCITAFMDKSTSLFNRNYLEQIIDKIKDFKNIGAIAIIFIDIDNLKLINDSHGHLAGDRVIELVGQAIKNSIRKEDIGIRYGGDEFIVLLFNQEETIANNIVNRINEEICDRNDCKEIDIRISTGIAQTECLKDLKLLIQMADNELYKQKNFKKAKKYEKAINIEQLKHEIEMLRNELNRKVLECDGKINNDEILKLSQKLDDLIIGYSCKLV